MKSAFPMEAAMEMRLPSVQKTLEYICFREPTTVFVP
jgi:hypothetical protein